MKKLDFSKVTRGFHKVGFQMKKHSPEILAVVGTVGVVTGAVMACKATLKVDTIMTEHKEQLDKVHECAGKEELKEQGLYTEQDYKKDLTIVYAQTGVKLAKLYAPAVAVGTLSLGCLLTSNNILRKRNVALAAAYATVEKGWKEYRGRVVDRFGETIDRELRYGIKAQEVENVVVDENGKETVVKDTVSTVESAPSAYARFFDELSPYWEKSPEYNLMFLKQCERSANRKLKQKGTLFLNEVYDMLGIPRTQEGQVIGWIYDDADYVMTENHVDFGIYDLHNQNKRAFVNGIEPAILLDFNVDGNVYDLM